MCAKVLAYTHNRKLEEKLLTAAALSGNTWEIINFIEVPYFYMNVL